MSESVMHSGIWLWLAFILAALATHIPRASFIVAGSRVKLPPGLQRALRYAPAAALSALIVPDIVLVSGSIEIFNPKILATIAVFVAATRWRNPWLPFFVGMTVLWSAQGLMTF
jgi:branched-subunit amino acid transport protein